MTRTSTPAVLYICASRSQDVPGVAHERAVQEGRDFAVKNGLRIVAEIVDRYGEPVPQRRAGWLKVREMAERGEVEVVITRWPNALSPASEFRHPELDHLGRHGAQLFFSWAPLSAMAGGGGAR
ncbi:hypothetical protein ACF082_01070 [Streptomyces lydicus]|uniref:hypothetical protein n=1 Tax=Streptomyces lydicus TaxID=47763 RepID=UPI0036F5FFD3